MWHLDEGTVSAVVDKWDRVAQIVENVLDSEAKTSRAARLLGQLLWALVVTVVGAVAIVALLASAVPWWAVASAAAAGGGAALIQHRRRTTDIEIPGPRPPS